MATAHRWLVGGRADARRASQPGKCLIERGEVDRRSDLSSFREL